MTEVAGIGTSPGAPDGGQPRWRATDLLLAGPAVAGLVVAAAGLGLVVERLAGVGPESGVGLTVLVPAWIGLQVGLGGWPLLVSRRRGRGLVADWGLRFKPVDAGLGVGAAVCALGAAGVVASILAAVVGLEEGAEVSNTRTLTDATDSPWFVVLLVLVVVVGPAAEELFFRGLVLRVVESWAGTAVGIGVSTLVFAAAHITGSSPAATVVLLGAIAAAGLVFAIFTVQTGRLGPAIVGHMVFNGIGAAVSVT